MTKAKTDLQGTGPVLAGDLIPPEQVEHYRVRMNAAFLHETVFFRPGGEYFVNQRVLDSNLPDGSAFKSKCASIEPVLKKGA